jgi:5-methylcytosine-specific restriction protein A
MHRRREFPPSVKREAHQRSRGICECHRIWRGNGCGQKLTSGNIFYEHIICDGIGGEPTLSNCACLTKTCWLKKTNGYDKPRVAWAKRQRDRDRGIRPTRTRPLPGTRASGIALHFNSPPTWRNSGRPLFKR